MKLRNQEIWLAYTNLEKISRLKLPTKTSLAVAVLMSKLQLPYQVIEGERRKLVLKHGKLDPETKQVNVALDSENAGDFAREYGEVLTEEWGDDLVFEKVTLPEKVIGVCEKCNHSMEIPFVIEPNTLIPLKDKFVE